MWWCQVKGPTVFRNTFFKNSIRLSYLVLLSALVVACNEKKASTKAVEDGSSGAIAPSMQQQEREQQNADANRQLEMMRISSQERIANVQAQNTKDQFNEQGNNQVQIAQIQADAQKYSTDSNASAQKSGALMGVFSNTLPAVAGGYFANKGAQAQAEAQKEATKDQAKNMLDVEKERQKGQIAVEQYRTMAQMSKEDRGEIIKGLKGEFQQNQENAKEAENRIAALKAFQGNKQRLDEALKRDPTGQSAEYKAALENLNDPKGLKQDAKNYYSDYRDFSGDLAQEARRLEGEKLAAERDAEKQAADLQKYKAFSPREMASEAAARKRRLKPTSSASSVPSLPAAEPQGSEPSTDATAAAWGDKLSKLAEQAKKDNLLSDGKFKIPPEDSAKLQALGTASGMSEDEVKRAAEYINGNSLNDVTQKIQDMKYNDTGFANLEDALMASGITPQAPNSAAVGGAPTPPVLKQPTPNPLPKPSTGSDSDRVPRLAQNDVPVPLDNSSEKDDAEKNADDFLKQTKAVAQQAMAASNETEKAAVEKEAHKLSAEINTFYEITDNTGTDLVRQAELETYRANFEKVLNLAKNDPKDFFARYGQFNSYQDLSNSMQGADIMTGVNTDATRSMYGQAPVAPGSANIASADVARSTKGSSGASDSQPKTLLGPG
jgi:hypothetical protein